MNQFIKTFQELVIKLCISGNQYEEWKVKQNFPESSTSPDFVAQMQEFSSHHQQIIQTVNQLAYFFFRDEMLWSNFLDDPKAIIEDPAFQYVKAPFTLREAESLHLLHQYSWHQVLRKIVQLDPVKGSLVFLLPPSGVHKEITEPDYLPECILMEAGLHKEKPLFFCWHVKLPDSNEFRVGDGESLVQLYDHMMLHCPPAEKVGIEEYLARIEESHQSLVSAKNGFENHSSFTGSRLNQCTDVWFLYWTEFYVYMCTLDRSEVESTLDSRIRKNSMIPINTVFCEGSKFRKFRLNFQEERDIQRLRVNEIEELAGQSKTQLETVQEAEDVDTMHYEYKEN
jgi:hypothetical protein